MLAGCCSNVASRKSSMLWFHKASLFWHYWHYYRFLLFCNIFQEMVSTTARQFHFVILTSHWQVSAFFSSSRAVNIFQYEVSATSGSTFLVFWSHLQFLFLKSVFGSVIVGACNFRKIFFCAYYWWNVVANLFSFNLWITIITDSSVCEFRQTFV